MVFAGDDLDQFLAKGFEGQSLVRSAHPDARYQQVELPLFERLQKRIAGVDHDKDVELGMALLDLSDGSFDLRRAVFSQVPESSIHSACVFVDRWLFGKMPNASNRLKSGHLSFALIGLLRGRVTSKPADCFTVELSA